MMQSAPETIVTVGNTQYLGANPQFSVVPANPAVGIMQPLIRKVLRGVPYIKQGVSIPRKFRRALRNNK